MKTYYVNYTIPENGSIALLHNDKTMMEFDNLASAEEFYQQELKETKYPKASDFENLSEEEVRSNGFYLLIQEIDNEMDECSPECIKEIKSSEMFYDEL